MKIRFLKPAQAGTGQGVKPDLLAKESIA